MRYIDYLLWITNPYIQYIRITNPNRQRRPRTRLIIYYGL